MPKRLPAAAEDAIIKALARVNAACEDKLVIRAAIQAIDADLMNAGFELREGFYFRCNGCWDMSGRNYARALGAYPYNDEGK